MTTKPHIRICRCCEREFLTTATSPTQPRCAECRARCLVVGKRMEHRG